jgi:ATP-dependent DNA helicase DinG
MKKPIELAEYIHPLAVSEMRSSIQAADGNEVFFLGKTDDKLIVKSVSVLARGDGESVPAITRSVSPGDVVIHNHPDGVIYPSKADLAVASELGNRGAGFYIVDNAVERIYPVVQPSQKEELVPLDLERLASYIRPGGPVSKALNDYEYREEQQTMMASVTRAFNEDRLALIEAGTGTGKSLAYLVPAISWSVLNGERVVVSTNTINLQEQLIGRDLPLLQRLKGLHCKAVLVKGRSNYLCLRKLAAAREEGRLLVELDGQEELGEIINWSEKTKDGSLSDLSFIPRRETWERVCAEADQCTRLHCSYYAKCFFYRARRESSSAHVLVVNHHLLMADLAVRSRTESYDRPAVLPRFQRIIIDEAQHIEDVATEYLGFQISKYGLLRVLRRLQSTRETARGLLPFLCAKLRTKIHDEDQERISDALELITETIAPERFTVEKKIAAAMERITPELKKVCGEEEGENAHSLRITPDVTASPFWQGVLCPVLKELLGAIGSFSGKLGELIKLLGTLTDRRKKMIESALVEIGAMRQRLTQHLECLTFFMEGGDGVCRWLELKGRGTWERLSFCAAPLDVSQGMREAIYERFGTVIMTSATLTVGGTFDYFRSRVGLKEVEKGNMDCCILPSPFNYRTQAFVASPRGIAEPGSEGYEDMLAEVVRQAVAISRGNALVLFTSYRLLERLHARLEHQLEGEGLTVLKQGSENRTALLNRFRREEGSVLFGTDSFWEGVDVRGEALQCVILTRLPFRVPDEPIQQARMEAIELAGGDPFLEYSVPQAVIKFRQGFGRLIRHREDVGAVLILDSRVHTSRYGKLFLESLPPASICSLDARGALAEMEKFFAGVRSARESKSPVQAKRAGMGEHARELIGRDPAPQLGE